MTKQSSQITEFGLFASRSPSFNPFVNPCIQNTFKLLTYKKCKVQVKGSRLSTQKVRKQRPQFTRIKAAYCAAYTLGSYKKEKSFPGFIGDLCRVA